MVNAGLDSAWGRSRVAQNPYAVAGVRPWPAKPRVGQLSGTTLLGPTLPELPYWENL